MSAIGKKNPHSSFEAAFRDNSSSLRAYLHRHLAQADAIEDAVQETWLRMMRYRQISSSDEIKALLFTVAASVLKDRIRRANSRLSGVHDPLEDQVLESPEPAMERQLIGRQELATVKQAIRNLPPRCREVFMLHRFEGLSYKEIAGRFGVSARTVENQVAHALSVCRKAIGESRP